MEGFSNVKEKYKRNQKNSPFKIQMPVSYSICTKIQAERNIYKTKKEVREILRIKRYENNGNRGMCRRYTYVGKDSAAYKYITVYGISQGEKFIDDIWEAYKSKI